MMAAARVSRSRGAAWWMGILACDLACAPPSVPPWVHPTPAEWREASAGLDQFRAALPAAPYTVLVSTTLRDPRSGRVIDGRGALAVAPGLGLRMILVGVAGATLLDAWVTPNAWRIAVPAASIVRRGGVTSPPTLPVAFLRWWFLGRFAGGLFASRLRPDERLWLVRDDDAVVELRLGRCERGTRLLARRRTADGSDRESVAECRAAAIPSAGDTVRYADETSGLEVTFAVEGIASEPPDPAAFRDPDEPTAGAVP
jgi:hypothetical protein